MIQKIIKELRALSLLQFIFLALAVAIILSLALIHVGLLKLPAAKAFACSKQVTSNHIFINITATGFQPNQIRAHVCDILVFTNIDSQPHWPAVGPHPSHVAYPGFDSSRGLLFHQTFIFQLNRSGDYIFHDHLNDNLTGGISILPF